MKQNINMESEQMNTTHYHYNIHKKFKMLILVMNNINLLDIQRSADTLENLLYPRRE